MEYGVREQWFASASIGMGVHTINLLQPLAAWLRANGKSPFDLQLAPRDPHTTVQGHLVIARKIAARPGLLEIARRNLAAWVARYGDAPPRAFEEWRTILARPWSEIAALIMPA